MILDTDIGDDTIWNRQDSLAAFNDLMNKNYFE